MVNKTSSVTDQPVSGGEMESKKSCVTDQPVSGKKADFLKNIKYAQGLIDFIMKADTPVTIGIQGGWGSGKTSLINMLKEGIQSPEQTQGDKAVCVVVNAWEHSLFAPEVGKSDIAISLLDGLVTQISEAIEDLNDIDPIVKQAALNKESGLAQAVSVIKNLTVFGVKVLAQSKGLGFSANSGDATNADSKQLAPESSAGTVRKLKKYLSTAISTIKNKSSYKRFVCFVDDLDRVPPQTAVEILDVLKNIFDIEDCIFVLAIDYEVVVKGLESKFGRKTEENEREFRQYFDKIIQIPFTMPVGSYKGHLTNFIKKFLEPMGLDPYKLPEKEAMRLSEVALWTTEGSPRAIKRIINTVSLLRKIEEISREDGEPLSEDARQNRLMLIFVVVALHINFPEICRALMSDHNFTKWNFQKCRDRFGLSEEDLDYISKNAKPRFFSEDWQKVIYCLCAKNRWLKDRAESVSQVLGTLRKVLNAQFGGAGDLGEEALDQLDEVLGLVRVVSVDAEAVMDIDDSDVRKDRVSLFFRRLHKALMHRVPGCELPDPEEDEDYHAAAGGGKKTRYREYYFGPADTGPDSPIKELCFMLYENTDTLALAALPRYYTKFRNVPGNHAKIMEKLEVGVLKLSPPPEASSDDEGWFYLCYNGFPKRELHDFEDRKDQVVPMMTQALILFKEVFESCRAR